MVHEWHRYIASAQKMLAIIITTINITTINIHSIIIVIIVI